LSGKWCWGIYAVPAVFTVSELTQDNYLEEKKESSVDNETHNGNFLRGIGIDEMCFSVCCSIQTWEAVDRENDQV
jgi:hypothetical protein